MRLYLNRQQAEALAEVLDTTRGLPEVLDGVVEKLESRLKRSRVPEPMEGQTDLYEALSQPSTAETCLSDRSLYPSEYQ